MKLRKLDVVAYPLLFVTVIELAVDTVKEFIKGFKEGFEDGYKAGLGVSVASEENSYIFETFREVGIFNYVLFGVLILLIIASYIIYKKEYEIDFL